MISANILKATTAVLGIIATLSSCAPSARDNAQWGIWAYSEVVDTCQISEIVKLYNSAGEFRNGGMKLDALIMTGEDALLTQRYRDRDEHLLRYIIAQPDYSSVSECISEFDIERSINGVREGRKTRYTFFQDTQGRLCKRTNFLYRLGAAADNGLTGGATTSCIYRATKGYEFNIDRAF